jgi:predicted O-methyltransferase YrrM
MNYKKYFRKTSLKQKNVGNFFLDIVAQAKPKNFLEIGVFHGVTARNVCELLEVLNNGDFSYTGVDLFQVNKNSTNEIIPVTKFSNPFKNFYFNYIKRLDPYSIEAVEDLLIKFKKKINLVKGNSNNVLKAIDMSKIDFIFLDGGHDYKTVINDLNCSIDCIRSGGVVLCDDYNLTFAPGVKKAIDEFLRIYNFNYEFFFDYRFVKISK